MIVDQVKVGSFRTNCYLLKSGNDVIIVDPGDDYVTIKNHIEGYTVVAILVTHYHFDHVGALAYFKNVDIYDYRCDKKKYNLDSFSFSIIDTKGHTSDSVSFYFEEEKVLFVGDFIFKNTIGRTDLETSSFDDINKYIEIIKKYPIDIKVYPGHGHITYLGDEIKNNPFF